MRWWSGPRSGRVPAMPADVRRGVPAGRVLAHAVRADGGWAVATTRALLLLDVGGGAVLDRPWHDVAEAAWDPEPGTVTVRWADGGPQLVVALAEPVGRLPEVLRERVTSTYVLSQRLTVRGRRGVTVAVRRRSDDRTLFAQAVADDGVDLQAPALAEQVAALTRDLAEQAGLR